MAGKHIKLYQGIKTVHACRLYPEAIRRLFHLPIRKGQIVSVALIGESIEIQFAVYRHKYINHTLTGGK